MLKRNKFGEFEFTPAGLCFADNEEDGGGTTETESAQDAIAAAKAPLEKKNRELLQEQKELKKKLDGLSGIIDKLGGDEGVERLTKISEEIEKDADLRLFTEGKREEYNERITSRMKAKFEGELRGRDEKIAGLEAENQELVKKHQLFRLETAIREKGDQKATYIDPLSRADAVRRAKDELGFDEEDDIIVLDKNGEAIRSANDPSKNMGLDEWLEERKADTNWFLKPDSLGLPGSRKREQKAPNPWARATRNLTKQAEILRENPQLAERLKAEAAA